MSFLNPQAPGVPAAPPPPPPIASPITASNTTQAMAAAAAEAGRGKNGTIKTSAQGAPKPTTTERTLVPVASTKSTFGG